MLAIDVELLHGHYRADPDGTAHTGHQEGGEWPPAVSRLFSALVAADGTRDRCRFTDGSELSWLEAQDPPEIHASDPTDSIESVLVPRFVVRQDDRAADSTVQEYLGRVATEIRPGVRVSPKDRLVSYRWSHDPPELIIRHLQLRAARIGYLGCADSPVRVTVRCEPQPPSDQAEARNVYRPDPEGDVAVGCLEPGFTDRLDTHFDRWLDGGPNVRRSHTPGLRRLVRYSSPGQSSRTVGDQADPPAVLWFLLDQAVSGRRVVTLTSALRATLLSRFDESDGTAPAVLHGHGIEGTGHDTARFLALPNVGTRRSDGRIHGAAIWLPPGTLPELVEQCREAMAGTVDLRGPGLRAQITPWAGQRRPWSASPDRWTGEARRWATAFPAVHERSRAQLDLDELALWCHHAGLPRPVAFRSQRSPFVAGGVDLAPIEVNRPGRPRRRYDHLEVVFERPVRGPIAIGAGRQFGLGLLAASEGGPDAP